MTAKQRILLLTNDDGIEAPGLRALREAAERFGLCRVVATQKCWSGCGHVATTGGAFRVVERDDGRFEVEGTPVDCVRVGLHHLVADADWILSGINAGGNLGTDVYHSGTVAAAREAALHGRPGLAISHYIAAGRTIDWPRARNWAVRVLEQVLARPCERGTFWNANLPHLDPAEADPAIVECPLDPSPLPLRYTIDGELVRYAGDYHGRERRPGSDVDVCFRGQIALTKLRLADAGAFASP